IWANAGDASRKRTIASSISLMSAPPRGQFENAALSHEPWFERRQAKQVHRAKATAGQRPAAWAPRRVIWVLTAKAARLPSASATSHSTRPTVLPPFFIRAIAVSVPFHTGRRKLIFISSVV